MTTILLNLFVSGVGFDRLLWSQFCGEFLEEFRMPELTSEGWILGPLDYFTKQPEYWIYLGMKERCYSESSTSYSHYGAKGIRLSDDWFGKDGFRHFYRDMGPRPVEDDGTPYSIERKDSKGNYCKENCCWIPQAQQSETHGRTILVEYNGQKKSITAWAKIIGINASSLNKRLQKMSVEEAFTKIPRDKNYYMLDGIEYSAGALASMSELPKPVVWSRLKQGWDVRRAITEPEATWKSTFEHNGVIYTCKDLAEITGLTVNGVWSRIGRGFTIEKILATPAYKDKTYEYEGKLYTLKELSGLSGIKHDLLIHRVIHMKWDIKKAVETPVAKRRPRSNRLREQQDNEN
jgi:hypothetical protein